MSIDGARQDRENWRWWARSDGRTPSIYVIEPHQDDEARRQAVEGERKPFGFGRALQHEPADPPGSTLQPAGQRELLCGEADGA